jgi:hypothetical protein
MNDLNTKYRELYALDVKAAYVLQFWNLKTTVSRINNLIANTQLVFCLMLQLGKRSTKVLLPGSPINFYGGVSVSYFFYKGINQELVFLLLYRLNFFSLSQF